MTGKRPRVRMRSLDLLLTAIRSSSRAYIFDNSSEEVAWLAEITDGKDLVLKTDRVPSWFRRSVLDKLRPGISPL